MFTMYRLILAILVNLLPTTLANGFIENAAIFGDDIKFYPFSQPSYLTQSIPKLPVAHVDPLQAPVGEFQSKNGKKTLIVLDNDGVLFDKPEDVEKAKALLKALAANENNEVWVNSARGLGGLGAYRDIPRLNIAAEHGTVLLVSTPEGMKLELKALHRSAQEVISAVKRMARGIRMSLYEGQNSIAYSYKSEASQDVKYMEQNLQNFLNVEHPDFMIRLEGDKNYGEVKHMNPDKGNFLAHLMATGRYANGLSMGDQESDEGMFKAMIQANAQIGGSRFYSVIVSKIPNQQTSAEYRLRNPQEVHQFLSKLILPQHAGFYPYW
ncbi:hypothetical protein PGT21_005967 [Puccinia graminis f. sp. tritici]|uniref:Threalose-6-phosphate phosphatase n=1 Tax=Puccinia graminis f. sp. tritici TaxID=56615 RepID=A0A5B0LMQ7_PUCGR|nr:hypothetical protein PGT21_005967 [Puccinia graminis f. sp. tritici]KAA1080058.1 hypothetical protein PGTUg99_025549 [Puccinia graminis f. sp. tritici]